MKKITLVMSLACMAFVAQSQDNAASDIDKKWRFGLRVTPQPSWLVTTDKNISPKGTVFGMGFGLNVEYHFSNVAAFLTGIGGDFEGGRYTFKHNPADGYEPRYWRDAEEFIPVKDVSSTSTQYVLKDRTIKTTHVTLPLILKLSTQEYGGIKYFGMFGAELGIRVKSTATDGYYSVNKGDEFVPASFTVVATDTKEKDINIRDETSLIPMRFGLNAGLGLEYRLGGSTSFFCSANFFRSFTNLMKKESDYTYYRIESGSVKYIKQNLKSSAIRINLGIMF